MVREIPNKSFLVKALAVLVLGTIACLALVSAPSASAALPGKLLAKDTDRDEAYLASSEIFTTSPNACFSTFSEPIYPCLRIKKPKAIWISGWYSRRVGWEFGFGGTDGWYIKCRRGRQVGTREQTNRDGLGPDEYWVNRVTLRLPFPMRNPDWCEVNVDTDSPIGPTIEEGWPWEYTWVVDSEVQLRATFRR